MANGLKFSDRELADLRKVVYGGYKKTDVRPVSVHPDMRYQNRTTGGDAIDYAFYQGQRPKFGTQISRGYDPYVSAEKGSTSANFAKIARELGINVDSTKDLQQVYDYVLGYTPPAAAPVQETAETDSQTGFDPGNVLSGLGEFDNTTGQEITPGETQPETQPGTQQPDFASILSNQIKAMQSMFTQSMQQQMMQFQQMQQAQNQRMEALQGQMMQSMRDQAAMREARPEVAGVKMAEGTGGTPMQIARRGGWCIWTSWYAYLFS